MAKFLLTKKPGVTFVTDQMAAGRLFLTIENRRRTIISFLRPLFAQVPRDRKTRSLSGFPIPRKAFILLLGQKKTFIDTRK
jgi:hypothetical protein